MIIAPVVQADIVRFGRKGGFSRTLDVLTVAVCTVGRPIT
jgi:hypothetical protein